MVHLFRQFTRMFAFHLRGWITQFDSKLDCILHEYPLKVVIREKEKRRKKNSNPIFNWNFDQHQQYHFQKREMHLIRVNSNCVFSLKTRRLKIKLSSQLQTRQLAHLISFLWQFSLKKCANFFTYAKFVGIWYFKCKGTN